MSTSRGIRSQYVQTDETTPKTSQLQFNKFPAKEIQQKKKVELRDVSTGSEFCVYKRFRDFGVEIGDIMHTCIMQPLHKVLTHGDLCKSVQKSKKKVLTGVLKSRSI